MPSTFSGVVEQINKVFSLNLNPENMEALTLSFEDHEIIFELDDDKEHLLAFTILGDLPKGRYREDVFVQALRSNGYPPPNLGVFCYSTVTDELILFHKVPITSVTEEMLMDTAGILYEKLTLWKEALASSMVPIIEKQKSSKPQMDLSSIVETFKGQIG